MKRLQVREREQKQPRARSWKLADVWLSFFQIFILVEQGASSDSKKHTWRNLRLISSIHVIKYLYLCRFEVNEWNEKLSFGAVKNSYRFCISRTLHPTTQCEEQSQIISIISLSVIDAIKHERWMRCVVLCFNSPTGTAVSPILTRGGRSSI